MSDTYGNVRSFIGAHETEISEVRDADRRVLILTVEYQTDPEGWATYWWRRGDPAYVKLGPFNDGPDVERALDRAFEAVEKA